MKFNLSLLLFAISLITFSQETKTSEDINNSDEVSFALVERVPIYKGCNENMENQDLKACFNEKINAHIAKNFNIKVADKLNLPDETIIKISVFFKIDKTGEIIDIKARAPYPELETEAIRTVNLLPKLQPGYIDGKPVRVPYYLPIKFKIDNPKPAKNDKFPVYRSCDETLSYEALKECTTNKIKDFIKLSVNYELADKLFPLDISTQFLVSFTINKKGKAEHITAKAHKKEMAAEAINVLKRMPKFKSPGYKNGNPIDTKMDILMTIYF